MSYQTVLFDLDGTLSDSAPGILASLELAFAEIGVPWLDPVTARTLLGPPFWHSLPPYVGADKLDAAVAAYRRHYVQDEGMYRTTRYDGVLEVVQSLSQQGIRLAVATSKPEPHAIKIVEYLGLGGLFETIGGDTVSGELGSKALVVGEVLRRLGNPSPETVLMVGDRSHDVLGAAAHGIGCAGVLWGYGSVEELTTAGALALCERPADILELVAAEAVQPEAG